MNGSLHFCEIWKDMTGKENTLFAILNGHNHDDTDHISKCHEL